MGIFSGISKAVGSIGKAVGSLSGSDWLSAGASALGFLGQRDANDTNMQIAALNNQTAIELANTAYQRKVKDLTAAGLNPMLAYINGSGGGASGAAVPQLQQAHVENTAASASANAVNAATVAKLKADTASSIEEANLKRSQAKQTDVQTYKLGYDIENTQQDTLLKYQKTDTELAHQRSLLASANLSAAQEAEVRQNIKNLQSQKKEIEARTDLTETEIQLALKRLPEADAMASMWSSDYGKNIAPYLSSAKDLSGLVGGGVGAFLGAGARSSAKSASRLRSVVPSNSSPVVRVK